MCRYSGPQIPLHFMHVPCRVASRGPMFGGTPVAPCFFSDARRALSAISTEWRPRWVLDQPAIFGFGAFSAGLIATTRLPEFEAGGFIFRAPSYDNC